MAEPGYAGSNDGTLHTSLILKHLRLDTSRILKHSRCLREFLDLFPMDFWTLYTFYVGFSVDSWTLYTFC